MSGHLLGRVAALVGLILASPLMLIASIAIKLSSPGPVLYRAARAGLDGTEFTMYKFRTMRNYRPCIGGRITAAGDRRVFQVGRWLRRLKIDELPQLVNVIGGQMAIVGPRPEDPTIVEGHYTAFMRETLTVLPGLTSPGSLAYFADESALSDAPDAERIYLAQILPRKIALDVAYVRNRSARYDAELIARTIGSIAGAHNLFPARQKWERAEAVTLLGEADATFPGMKGRANEP